mmetsp:Transcript_27292/g.33045  ORF Transcript_27292/g.33045 Transcript_27292/m.33045 type:complete len:95 (-) Transcript_27292:197-481(-)
MTLSLSPPANIFADVSDLLLISAPTEFLQWRFLLFLLTRLDTDPAEETLENDRFLPNDGSFSFEGDRGGFDPLERILGDTDKAAELKSDLFLLI